MDDQENVSGRPINRASEANEMSKTMTQYLVLARFPERKRCRAQKGVKRHGCSDVKDRHADSCRKVSHSARRLIT